MSDSRTAAWNRIEALPQTSLSDLFAGDETRVERLSGRIGWGEGEDAAGIRFDWSKTHLTGDLLDAFEELAQASDFAAKRAALFSGDTINITEGRAAEHTAQRGFGSEASVEEAQALQARMQMLVEAIREKAFGEIDHLIHIGIGGSALGPALAVDALTRDLAYVDCHVVSNIDGVALEEAFAACDPASTLVAVASKTFTTIETMTNAESAMRWLREGGVSDPHGRVVALTANPERAVEWGVDETRILPFMESVGGRYSLWSSIGFPVALAAGWDEFAAMLDGAAAVDAHFANSDGRENLCLRAALPLVSPTPSM